MKPFKIITSSERKHEEVAQALGLPAAITGDMIEAETQKIRAEREKAAAEGKKPAAKARRASRKRGKVKARRSIYQTNFDRVEAILAASAGRSIASAPLYREYAGATATFHRTENNRVMIEVHREGAHLAYWICSYDEANRELRAFEHGKDDGTSMAVIEPGAQKRQINNALCGLFLSEMVRPRASKGA